MEQEQQQPRSRRESTPSTNQFGATRTKDTKTPKGALIPIYHAKGRTTIFELPFLVLYVMSMDIILIIAPKFLISNG
jgi:hypothetical protein